MTSQRGIAIGFQSSVTYVCTSSAAITGGRRYSTLKTNSGFPTVGARIGFQSGGLFDWRPVRLSRGTIAGQYDC